MKSTNTNKHTVIKIYKVSNINKIFLHVPCREIVFESNACSNIKIRRSKFITLITITAMSNVSSQEELEDTKGR